MNRTDLQQLATVRIVEAKALLAAGLPAGAYYLAGYAVECGIKSCIAKRVQQHDFPDRNTVEQSYKHDLEKLIKTANLTSEFDVAKSQNAALDDCWKVVKDWNESKRYETAIDTASASALISAIADPQNGVLTWLMQRW